MSKRTITFGIATLLAIALVGTGVWAVCGGSKIIGNTTAGYQQNISGTLNTDIITKFWRLGNAATDNSGTLLTDGMVLPYATGYYAWSDWGNTGVVGCIPSTVGERTVFLYNIANSGAARFLVMSVANQGSDTYDYGTVTNGPGNVLNPVAIPVPTVSGNTGPGTATITWTPNTMLKGYYDSAPTNNVITGYTIRYITTAGVAPATFATGSWTACTTGSNVNIGAAGADPGTAAVTFPAPGAGQRVYLAISVLFDGAAAGDTLGRETAFVGAPSGYFGPTAAPTFASVSATSTGVNFTSGAETRVASYQAFWATTASGTYQAAGLPVTARGDNSTYSISYRIITKSPTFFVKVKAAKTDGTSDWSSPVQVTQTSKLSPKVTTR